MKPVGFTLFVAVVILCLVMLLMPGVLSDAQRTEKGIRWKNPEAPGRLTTGL